MDAYSESKALAEQAVLDAHDVSLRTVVLRACGMYGEADPYHMDNVLTSARDGKLTFRVGSPETVFEHVYVGNVAYAHALATFAMFSEEPPPIAGNKYFVTDQPADNFFEFMRKFVERLGHEFPPASRTIPAWVAMLAGRANEGFARLVQPLWKLQPRAHDIQRVGPDEQHLDRAAPASPTTLATSHATRSKRPSSAS